MKAVVCGCGANLALAPAKATWIMSGHAFEVRDCVACGSTKSFTRYAQLGGGNVTVLTPDGRRLEWADWSISLEDALEALTDLGRDDEQHDGWRAIEPVGTWLFVGEWPNPKYVARVLPNGLWLSLPPEG